MRGSKLKSLFYAGILGMFAVGINACTPWPNEGGGGISERRAVESPELSALADRLQNAIELGAHTSYAAQTAEAQMQLTRVRRLWEAGFIADYTIEYQKLDVLVQDIEAHITSRKRVR